MERAAKVSRGSPVPLGAGTPPGLQAICRRALRTDPADRYPDGEALAQDLDRYLAGEQPVSVRRGRLGAGVAAALALVLAGGLATAWAVSRRSAPPAAGQDAAATPLPGEADEPAPGAAKPAGSEVSAAESYATAVERIETRLAHCQYPEATALCEAALSGGERPKVRRLLELSRALGGAGDGAERAEGGADHAGGGADHAGGGADHAGGRADHAGGRADHAGGRADHDGAAAAQRLARRCADLEERGYRWYARLDRYDFAAISQEARRLCQIARTAAKPWGPLGVWVRLRAQRAVGVVAITRASMIAMNPADAKVLERLVGEACSLEPDSSAVPALRLSLAWEAFAKGHARSADDPDVRKWLVRDPAGWADLLPPPDQSLAYGLWFLAKPVPARRPSAERSLGLPLPQDRSCQEMRHSIYTRLGMFERWAGSADLAAGEPDAAQRHLDEALRFGKEGAKPVMPDDSPQARVENVAQLVITFLARGQVGRARRVIRREPGFQRPSFDYLRTLLDGECDLVAGLPSDALARLELLAAMPVKERYVEEFTARAHARFLLGDADGANAQLAAVRVATRSLGVEWHAPERVEAVMAGAWWPGRGAR
jgi:hypothetical protein